MSDEDLIALYTPAVVAASDETRTPHRLEKPDGSAKAVSPICGSVAEIDLIIKDNRVAAFGYDVEACALGRFVASVMKRAIIGKTREEIAAAGKETARMLQHGDVPTGDWKDLAVLKVVADYPARHNSVLLPFEAADKAFIDADRRRTAAASGTS